MPSVCYPDSRVHHIANTIAPSRMSADICSTKAWGIIYQRLKELEDLPDIPFEFLENDPNLPLFPSMAHNELLACLDAAHGTKLLSCRSVTGLIVFYCGAAIAWKSRVQPIVATSSTEAEFYSAVTTAKIVKYLRYVLSELDSLRPGPTRLLIDNIAALNMINESRPTPRARHIEIQHFAIQEWCKQGDIVMEHLPGIINPSDGLTKALGWVLLSRHARRGMGHYRSGSTVSAPRPLLPPALEAGEGVGTQISVTAVALGPARDSPVMDRKIESLTPPTGGSLSIQSSG